MPPKIIAERGGFAIKHALNRAQIIRWIAQAWLLLLIVGSLQPARPGPVLAHHRGLHFLAFGGAAFLLLLLSRNWYQEVRMVVSACLLGLSLEFLQHLFYRNVIEWWDVRDDALAVLATFALYRLALYVGYRSRRSALLGRHADPQLRLLNRGAKTDEPCNGEISVRPGGVEPILKTRNRAIGSVQPAVPDALE